MPKRKTTDTDPADAPPNKSRTKKSNLPAIPWQADNNKLIWALLTEIEKPENSKILFGMKAKGENTSGDTKVAVYKFGERCKAMMVEKLIKGYKENAQSLRQTGGGVGAEEAQEEGSQTVNMVFYIPATGPDCTTLKKAPEEIINRYPFFPRLHVIFATRPNVTPIAISTGLDGTVHHTPRGPLCSRRIQQGFKTSSGPVTDGYSGIDDEDDGAHVDEEMHNNGGVPAVPATPAHTGNPTAKENVLPTTASKTRGPKALQQDASVERARAAIKKLPVRRTPLEQLLSLQESNLNSMNARANAEAKRADGELVLKRRQLLLKELELGVWTPEEYRKQLKKLDKTTKHKKAAASRSRREKRASSPEWPSEFPLSDGIPDDDSE
ncbi:hypothetical protein C8J57DRAFT_1533837 [Mycena rebaudengoi]|nr:hypothetical protein C8J57DRAFT_1533837 [Mycena rebaudengoi]